MFIEYYVNVQYVAEIFIRLILCAISFILLLIVTTESKNCRLIGFNNHIEFNEEELKVTIGKIQHTVKWDSILEVGIIKNYDRLVLNYHCGKK